MPIMTELGVRRTFDLADYLEIVPPDEFLMNSYRSKCGTTACVAGYAVAVVPKVLSFKWYGTKDHGSWQVVARNGSRRFIGDDAFAFAFGMSEEDAAAITLDRPRGADARRVEYVPPHTRQQMGRGFWKLVKNDPRRAARYLRLYARLGARRLGMAVPEVKATEAAEARP